MAISTFLLHSRMDSFFFCLSLSSESNPSAMADAILTDPYSHKVTSLKAEFPTRSQFDASLNDKKGERERWFFLAFSTSFRRW